MNVSCKPNVKLFDDFFNLPEAFLDPWNTLEQDAQDMKPSNYSIYEKEKKLHIDVQIPGLSEHDIKVSINKKTRRLHIEGQKIHKDHKKEEEKIVWYKQAQVSQKFTHLLPEKIDIDSVLALYKNGILELTFNLIH